MLGQSEAYRPFVSFKGEVGAAIRDVRRALNEGSAHRELTTLLAMLWNPWGRGDEAFLKEVGDLELARIRLKARGVWPRERRPKWQVRYFSALIGLAQRNDLLDLEMEDEFDRE